MSTQSRWLLSLAGLLLLVGAPLVWWLGQPAPSAGELPESFLVESEESEEDLAIEEPDEEPAETPDETSSEEPAEAPEPEPEPEPATNRPPKPVSVSLPAIDVGDAEVVEVGLDDNRAVEIPDDVRQVGWYNRGPRPGEDGNAFMTSHIDSRTQGRGVLFDLRRSEPGDPVIVTHEDGSTSDWVVVARERIQKGEYPMEQVFRFDGEPGLVIDTCGGAFNEATGHYESIDIIYAVPADAAPDDLDAEAAAPSRSAA